MIKDSAIANMRKVYQLQSLSESEVDKNPIRQFQQWWQHAVDTHVDEPNAMTLATASHDGKPSARIVLLKEINRQGFVFFTNYRSRKATELLENPFASLVFFWKELERQVRIEGTVKKISENESDVYFAERPRESQIGAWSSPQSKVIESRSLLQENVEKYQEMFNGKPVQRPEFWGGFIVEPEKIEFWQGRPGRLHDRLQYSLQETSNWIIRRLAP